MIKHTLLGLLETSPKHGYDLKRDFDDLLGDVWDLNVGQIYTTLQRLQRDGLVESDLVDQENKPDKRVYRITDSGRTALIDWLNGPAENTPSALRNELLLKLLFLEQTDADTLLRQIQEQHGFYMAYMMRLTSRKFQLEQASRHALSQTTDEAARKRLEIEQLIKQVILDAALFHVEADIRWLRHTEARIKEIMAE